MGYGIIFIVVNFRGIIFLIAGFGLSFCVLAVGCKKKDDSSPAGPSNPKNLSRIFVTQAVFDGNLGGLGGANSKCQVAATGAGLGGTWIAWLSMDTPPPLTPSPTPGTDAYVRTVDISPWYLVDAETLIFKYRQWPGGSVPKGPDLQTTPGSPINMDEYGSNSLSFQNYSVWTGSVESGVFGVSGSDCQGWTSNSPADLGDRGFALGNLRNWTGRPTGSSVPSAVSCREFLHLYCIEQ